MAIDIDNNQRFWFIIWVLFCKKHGLDHKTEDWNKVKDIDEAEYTQLEAHAMFEILNSGKCPVCWEPCNALSQVFDGDTGKCDMCGVKYSFDNRDRMAKAEEK